ncbi:formate dehydrogenase accessory sulfurtransferase FdhD [Bacillus taeanensis]|uniref:Sulfur carrier protein FdhD n=1 Tax=Bacillus taeanensis TaxID=273032 RepID=A0A366Y2Y6_9BACI|nr:formate dehydrogenase accessory sulfurtransferase FdhD [Bacillus taeanensis]RBW71369.1 formate dehydrogenase accessory sulfurtransferase FdhD [Bacillus taeanensis]
MAKPITSEQSIIRYDGTTLIHGNDHIAVEFPLTIMLNGEEFATMVCTPENLEDMVIGFLASEGIIRFYHKEVKSLTIDENRGFAYVELYKKPMLNERLYTKRFIGSCCGKSRQGFYFQNDVRTAKTSSAKTILSAQNCLALMKEMQNNSTVFKDTGGVHNAALCDSEKMLITRTDIGRHNALDKLYGHCLIKQISVRDKILAFSGRISSEVLLKASKIGVGIMLSKSAPTDLALKIADELNITTVGFIRDNKMNIYTHPERIV